VIDDVDMKMMSDSDLLEMWADQNELIDGLVDRVLSEINRRGLDTGAVQVRTGNEINQRARLARLIPKKIKGKLPRILVATLVGLASGGRVLRLCGIFGLVGDPRMAHGSCVHFLGLLLCRSTGTCGSNWVVDVSQAFRMTLRRNPF
jgi:hypothetical protein